MADRPRSLDSLLPPVPEFLTGREYKPSGKCPWIGYVAVIGLYLPVAFLARATVQLVAPLICRPAMRGVLGMLSVHWLAFVIVAMVWVVGILLPPAGGGMAAGLAMGEIAKLTKCRSQLLMFYVGFLSGPLAYALYALLDRQLYGSMHLTYGMFSSELLASPKPRWLVVLVGIDAILFSVGVLAGWVQVLRHPYCEECGEWYGSWKEAFLGWGQREALIGSLRSATDELPDTLPQGRPTERVVLRLRLRACPSCTTADYQLDVRAQAMKVETDSQGNTTRHETTKDWFMVMIPAELGSAISAKLHPAKRLREHVEDFMKDLTK